MTAYLADFQEAGHRFRRRIGQECVANDSPVRFRALRGLRGVTLVPVLHKPGVYVLNAAEMQRKAAEGRERQRERLGQMTPLRTQVDGDSTVAVGDCELMHALGGSESTHCANVRMQL